jgi:release factor glutamine methyltransferase
VNDVEQTKQYEVLQWASLFLENHQREAGVADILLQHYLNVSRSKFYTMMRDPVPEEIIKLFQSAIREHAVTGIPVQHVVGYEVFYGREFAVNEHVLIPRPETEELVQCVIQTVQQCQQPLTIVDVGTGSGIIAITLALELPHVTVYATDISPAALEVAKKNAEQLQAKVTFLEGDFLQPLQIENRKVDIIVSNPPYIARSEEALLADTVKNFDPDLALFASDNGLAAYSRIIEQSQRVVWPDSTLVFEIGDTQSEAVSKLIEKTYPASTIQTIKDINKRDRIIIAQL